MLRVIMLSLVWAICSTCLVRPWFWKGVINKTLVKNNKENMNKEDLQNIENKQENRKNQIENLKD